MSPQRWLYLVLGTISSLTGAASPRARRDERGLSQSTENVILLVGAVTIAGIVIFLVTSFVRTQLKLGT